MESLDTMVNLTPSPPVQANHQKFYNAGAPPPNGAKIPAAMFNPTKPPSDDGGTDPKRRRIARACDMCRKKKIKCDGKLPSCTHCVNYKTECMFTLVEKKRNPPKGAKYIEGLENRLGRMESLLKLSGLLPEGDDQTDLGDLERRLQESTASSQRAVSTFGRSSSESARGTPCSSSIQSATGSPQNHRNEEEVEALSDQMCSLVTNNCGETRFIGSSSGFSIFSPKGIQWVNEKTGDSSFQQMIQDATASKLGQRPFDSWKPDVFGEIFNQRGKNKLPPKPVAQLLVNDFFNGFNVLFPLFHKETFEKLFEKQYSDHPPLDSSWYAAFNILLAIACRLRISRTPEGSDRAAKVGTAIKDSWGYFQNAVTVLTELLLRNTDLLSIQAILGMVMFMQGTANPQPSYFLIAAAVRIATSIGMHRRGNSFDLNPFEAEQRRRIFWLLYMIDKDMALRSGRPPCINDDDCNVELPDECPSDGVGDIPLGKGKVKFNIFRNMAQFGVIQSKVYMQLYSAKAGKQSDGELLNTIGELDKELEDWKDSIPTEIRPLAENDMAIVTDTEHGLLVIHVVLLHFAYYNCLTTIHRMSIHHGYWTSRLSNYAIAGLSVRPLNPRVFSSAALCVSAARASIHLIKYVDPKDYPCIWLVMYYPVSSLVTLFANILQNPQDPRARSDLRLMNAVMDFLHMIIETDEMNDGHQPNEDDSVGRMLMVCGEFQRISRLVLDKAEKENLARRKRKPEEQLSKPARQQENSHPHTTPPYHNHPHPPTSNSPVTPMQNPMGYIPHGMDAMNPHHIFANDLTQSFSPASSMSWLNDIGSPGGPSPIPQPLTGESLHHIPMVSANSFEQPFVPQDLWQMPMTFEWDWAEVNPNMQHMSWDPVTHPQ